MSAYSSEDHKASSSSTSSSSSSSGSSPPRTPRGLSSATVKRLEAKGKSRVVTEHAKRVELMDLQVHYVELRNQMNFLKAQDLKLSQMLKNQLLNSGDIESDALKALDGDVKDSQEDKISKQVKKSENIVDIRDKGAGQLKGSNPFAILEDEDSSNDNSNSISGKGKVRKNSRKH